MNALAENKNSYAFLGPFLSLDMRQFHTISCARELCQSKHAVSPLQGIHQTWEKNGGHTCRRSTKIYLLVAMFQRSGLAKWRQDLCGSLANGGLCVYPAVDSLICSFLIFLREWTRCYRNKKKMKKESSTVLALFICYIIRTAFTAVPNFTPSFVIYTCNSD